MPRERCKGLCLGQSQVATTPVTSAPDHPPDRWLEVAALPGRQPTAVLADSHPLTLEALGNLLEPTVHVLAKVLDGRSLCEAASRLLPDLAIVDISMPVVGGIEAIRHLKATSPATRTVIFSCYLEDSWVRAAFEAGARGYLSKAAAVEEIDGAIREVLHGHFYVSPSATHALVGPLAPLTPSAANGEEMLTPREQEVVRLVARGMANKEIAHRLGVSVTTVRSHLRHVYEKLGRKSRIELALHAANTAAVGI